MEVSQGQIAKWDFFCREIAKANDILDIIERIYKHINLRNNAYNAFLALTIDSLTTKVFLTLGHIFDNQDDSLRLTRIITDKADVARIEQLKIEANPFIEARHKQHAHLSKAADQINYKSNFRLMDQHNADKIREILNEVGSMLRRWGVANNGGKVIADRWGNIGISAELLFEDLKAYELISSKMSTEERAEIAGALIKDEK